MNRARSLTLLLSFCAAAASAQEVALTYTAAQAARGAVVYQEACAVCHGANLDDGAASVTQCSAFCATTADCGAGQICQPVLSTDNSTADDADDTSFGLCTPITPADPADACAAAQDCIDDGTGDDCDDEDWRVPIWNLVEWCNDLDDDCDGVVDDDCR